MDLAAVIDHRRWARGALVGVAAVVLCVVTAAELTLAAEHGGRSLFSAGSDVLFGLAWATVGLAVHHARPQDLTGRLMIVAGVAFYVSAPGSFGLPTDLDLRWLATVGWAYGWWIEFPVMARLLVGFPTGRVTDSMDRWLIRAFDIAALVVPTVWLLLLAPERARCGTRCPVSPISLNSDPGVYRVAYAAGLGLLTVGALLGVGLILRRYARASPRARRGQRLGAVITVVVISLFALFAWLTASVGSFDGPHWIVYVLAYLVVLAVPALLGLSALQQRIAKARVADAIGSSGALSVEALEPALAAALDDPALRIAYPAAPAPSGSTQHTYVDSSGHPVECSPAGQTITPIWGASGHLAVLMHDPELLEHPELLESAVAAARLTIENAALRADLNAQLTEVRASRARIVAATDRERQRMERNLHDGAQQHLLGIGLSLRLLRSSLESGEMVQSAANLSQAEADLHAAIAELRQLAQGLHPAVLDDQGLVAALGVVARISPTPVTITTSIPGRLAENAEHALYYACAEAIQNVNKHAAATTVTVHLWKSGELAGVDVRDDGKGGATVNGASGLRGLIDRLEAAGGSIDIDSPHGGGTTLRMRLPCV